MSDDHSDGSDYAGIGKILADYKRAKAEQEQAALNAETQQALDDLQAASDRFAALIEDLEMEIAGIARQVLVAVEERDYLQATFIGEARSQHFASVAAALARAAYFAATAAGATDLPELPSEEAEEALAFTETEDEESAPRRRPASIHLPHTDWRHH